MSGRDLVDEMRSGVRPISERSPRGIFDMVIAATAIMAVGALGVVAYGAWFPAKTPRPVQVASAAPASSWTETDAARCDAKAIAASDNPDTGNYMITSRSISEGLAFLTTKVECLLTTKADRFCSPEGKSQLVTIVNDYFNRLDLVKLGIAAQGAPMALVGSLAGGEAAMGDAVYGSMASDTLAYMAEKDARVVAAIRKLGSGDVIDADAFRPLPFAGLPKRVEEIFADVSVTSHLCA